MKKTFVVKVSACYVADFVDMLLDVIHRILTDKGKPYGGDLIAAFVVKEVYEKYAEKYTTPLEVSKDTTFKLSRVQAMAVMYLFQAFPFGNLDCFKYDVIGQLDRELHSHFNKTKM